MRTLLMLFAVGLLFGSLAVAQQPGTPATDKTPPAVAAKPAQPAAPVAAPGQTGTPAVKPATKPAAPAQPAAKPAAAGPEDAVRKASKEYIAALNAGDFKKAATFWTSDGQYVDKAGKSLPASKLIAEELPKRFPEGKRPQLALSVKSIGLLTPDIAQEEGTVQVKNKEGQAAPHGGFNAVWVRQQNKWLLKSLRETSAAAMTHTHTLEDLAWLVGSWGAANDKDDVYSDCKWSPGKVYLLRQITIMRDGKAMHVINQRIGLDPLSPKIKSWSFDGDGGLAEAYWEKVGDSWYVASRGASRQGHITTARNVYEDIGSDTFTIASDEAFAGTSKLPAFKLKFSRDNSLETADANGTGNPSNAGNPPNTGNNTANPPSNNTANPSPGTDSLAKEKILNSPEWRQTQQAFHEWLTVQKIYTPAEVKQLKAETAERIAKMSASQLADFVEDSKEKVAILMSKQAEDARLWLAQRMAVEVKLTPEEIKLQRPDIAHMSAAQVEQRLMQIQQQRKQTQDAQKAFVADRKFRIKSIDDQEKEAENERQQALNRSAEELSSGYGGYYGGYGGGYGGYGGGRGYYGGGYGGWGGYGGFRW